MEINPDPRPFCISRALIIFPTLINAVKRVNPLVNNVYFFVFLDSK